MTQFEYEKELELYKKMYSTLFNTITDVIETTQDEQVKRILISAQQKTEEIYING